MIHFGKCNEVPADDGCSSGADDDVWRVPDAAGGCIGAWGVGMWLGSGQPRRMSSSHMDSAIRPHLSAIGTATIEDVRRFSRLAQRLPRDGGLARA